MKETKMEDKERIIEDISLMQRDSGQDAEKGRSVNNRII